MHDVCRDLIVRHNLGAAFHRIGARIPSLGAFSFHVKPHVFRRKLRAASKTARGTPWALVILMSAHLVPSVLVFAVNLPAFYPETKGCTE